MQIFWSVDTAVLGSNGVTLTLTSPEPYKGDVWLNTSQTGSEFGEGLEAYKTVIHEIGHALGLSHPGEYDGSGNTYSDNRDFFRIRDSSQSLATSERRTGLLMMFVLLKAIGMHLIMTEYMLPRRCCSISSQFSSCMVPTKMPKVEIQSTASTPMKANLLISPPPQPLIAASFAFMTQGSRYA